MRPLSHWRPLISSVADPAPWAESRVRAQGERFAKRIAGARKQEARSWVLRVRSAVPSLSAIALALFSSTTLPSVGVDTRPLAPRWTVEERDRLDAALVSRLHDNGYPVAQESGAIEVEVEVAHGTGEGLAVTVRSSLGELHFDIDGTLPRGLLTLHVVHRVTEAVEAFQGASPSSADDRLHLRPVVVDGALEADVLVALIRRNVVVEPTSLDAATEATIATLCIVASQGPVAAYPPEPRGTCGPAPADLVSLEDALTALASARSVDPAVTQETSDASGSTLPAAPHDTTSSSTGADGGGPSKGGSAVLAPGQELRVAGERRRWDYDVAILAQVLFRGALPPAQGFDGGTEVLIGATHRTGWGGVLSTRWVPSRGRDLWVLEAFLSAGPSYRAKVHHRVLLAVSLEGGVSLHNAWYEDAPRLLDVAPHLRIPVRAVIPVAARLRVYLSVHAGYVAYRRRHVGPEGAVLWDRYGFSGGLALGLGAGGSWP